MNAIVELVGKIFQTLEISQLAFIQMALVLVLVFLLSMTLIRPILSTFQERERRTTRPVEESRVLLAEAEAKTAEYEDSLRKAAAESLAGKRRKMEESGRAERKRIEEAVEESNRRVEEMKARIAAEKEETAGALRIEVPRLAVEIAVKVLGRPVA
jgi:F-type H+-transporting ATPase subunit b